MSKLELYVSIKEFLKCWEEIKKLPDIGEDAKIPLSLSDETKLVELIRRLPVVYQFLTVKVTELSLEPSRISQTSLADVSKFFECFDLNERLQNLAQMIPEAAMYSNYSNTSVGDLKSRWDACILKDVKITGRNLITEIRLLNLRSKGVSVIATCISRSYPNRVLSTFTSYTYKVHNYIRRDAYPIWEEISFEGDEPELDDRCLMDEIYIPVMELQNYLDECLKFSGGVNTNYNAPSKIDFTVKDVPKPFATLKCLSDKAFEDERCMSEIDIDFADIKDCGAGYVYRDPLVKEYVKKYERTSLRDPKSIGRAQAALDFFELTRNIIRRDFKIGEFSPTGLVFVGKDKFEKGTRTIGNYTVGVIKYQIHAEQEVLKGEQAINIYTLDEISPGGVPISSVDIPLLTQPIFETRNHAFNLIAGQGVIYQGEIDGMPFVKDMFVPRDTRPPFS